MTTSEVFRKARSKGVPLIVVRTADPAATIRTLAAIAQDQDGADTPVMHWNLITGLEGFNEAGATEAKRVTKKPTFDPTGMLSQIAKCAEDSLVFMQNAQRFWTETPTMQAIWNLRDEFKVTAASLCMLVTKGATLPPELAQDCLIVDEPLPTEDQLKAIISETFDNAELPKPSAEILARATDAVLGLPAFPAEQSAALNISKKSGLSLGDLWETKRKIIEQTQGLSVDREGMKFAGIGGNGNVIEFLRKLSRGRKRIRGTVFVDELEKAFAGFGTDTSGTKTEMVGTFLQWSQDHKIPGVLFRGVSGSGKSAVAKAFGNEIEALTLRMNIEAMQGSLVGQSGERLRAALAVVDSMFQGDCLLIGTVNRSGQMPPELESRFTLGTFFFDMPSEEEQAAIWKIYTAKYELADQPRPASSANWTGREIEACCYKAWLLNTTLQDAASTVVPIAISRAEEIRQLRDEAQGCYISASQPGPYKMPSSTGKPSRKIKQDADVAVSNLPNLTGEA